MGVQNDEATTIFGRPNSSHCHLSAIICRTFCTGASRIVFNIMGWNPHAQREFRRLVLISGILYFLAVFAKRSLVVTLK